MKLRRRTSERGGEGGDVGEACAHPCAAALLCEVKLDPRCRIHARLAIDRLSICLGRVERARWVRVRVDRHGRGCEGIACGWHAHASV